MYHHAKKFDFFDTILERPDWVNKTVLDFGGSHGNIIRDDVSKIEPKNYTCVDVDNFATILGNDDYPEAAWHHFDRYQPHYNPTGIVGEPLPMLARFDFILAFSVFTHTPHAETKELVHAMLHDHLNDDGVMVVTFLEPYALPWFLEHRAKYETFDQDEKLEQVKHLDYFWLHDGVEINQNDDNADDTSSYTGFHTPKYFLSMIAEAGFKQRYVCGRSIDTDAERQSCIIITK
jgi:hypothetical protein